jgi:hypothetical protein
MISRLTRPAASRAGLLLLVTAVISLLAGRRLEAATLRAEALRDWDQYIRWADAKFARELADTGKFLYREYLPAKDRKEILDTLAAGHVPVRRVHAGAVVPAGSKLELPDAAIHHWWGSIVVPGVRLDDVLRLAKDYDHHAGRFVEVQQAKLLSRTGETYRFFFRLRRSKAPVTVYYNTEQQCTYTSHGPTLASSRSVALKIAELEAAGTPRERERSNQDDSGFLWRAVTWWRFKETAEGVTIECETASLSRSIPGFLRFIPGAIGYLESVPRESIENILTSLRKYSVNR